MRLIGISWAGGTILPLPPSYPSCPAFPGPACQTRAQKLARWHAGIIWAQNAVFPLRANFFIWHAGKTRCSDRITGSTGWTGFFENPFGSSCPKSMLDCLMKSGRVGAPAHRLGARQAMRGGRVHPPYRIGRAIAHLAQSSPVVVPNKHAKLGTCWHVENCE